MRKRSLKWLSAVCMFFLSIGCMLWGAACSDSSYELYGFTPMEEIIVASGDFVEAETLSVSDSEGNYYDVKYKVTDRDGKQVKMSGKGFFALGDLGYKIVYIVIDIHGEVHTRETLVKVKDDGDDKLGIYVPETGIVNEPVEIEIDRTLSETYTFSIAVIFGNETQSVEGYTFIPKYAGEYMVEVTAVSEQETIRQSYTVNIKPEMTEGTVEIFDESWSNNRGGWKVETTEETGLKDRFGGDGSYLALETDSEYLNAFVCPEMDKEYYELLAKQGYEYVSVWIYIDGRLAHTVQQYTGYGPFYQTSLTVLPGTWHEIRYQLQDDPQEDYKGSFLRAFRYYADQTQPMFLVDNSDMYNGVNGGRERDEQGNIVPYKIYVDDIYAVRAGESIAIDDMALPSLKTGETYDLKNLIESEMRDEFVYMVTCLGETEVAKNGIYTFSVSGVHEITVSYGAEHPNRYGQAVVTLRVDSPYKIDISPLIREKTGDTVNVGMNEFDVSVKDADGAFVRNVSVDYKVFKNGVEIPVKDGGITLSEIGWYNVEVELSYKIGDVDCKTYVNADLDVWDEENKYTVFDFNGYTDYFADSYYMNKGWDIVPQPSVVREIQEKRGNFVKVEITDQQQPVFSVKPLYSLNYYTWLAENDTSLEILGELFVSFEYMVEDKLSIAEPTRRIAVFPSGALQIVDCGKWYTVSFSLKQFVEDYYARMYDGYSYLKELRGGANITIDNTQGYALLYLSNPYQYATNIYIGACAVGCKTYDGQFLDINDSEHIYAWDYNWQRLDYSQVFSVKDQSIDGETGTMLCYDGTQQRFGLQYISVYSKEYYEYILKRYPSAYVSVKLYVEIDGKDEGVAWVSGLGGDAEKVNLGEWITVRIGLSDIVAYYEAMAITETGNSERENLISVENGYYATGGVFNNLRVFFSGFDFVLGDEASDEDDEITEKEEDIGYDIFE